MTPFGLSKFHWKLSAKWFSNCIDCTPHGIVNRCHGVCCTKKFWPGKAQPQESGYCYYHNPNKGCSLEMQERPITCLLYPFVVNKHDTIVRHFRAGVKGVSCYPNIDETNTPLHTLFKPTFNYLFGKAYNISKLSEGLDLIIVVPKWLEQALSNEYIMEKTNTLPPPREE